MRNSPRFASHLLGLGLGLALSCPLPLSAQPAAAPPPVAKALEPPAAAPLAKALRDGGVEPASVLENLANIYGVVEFDTTLTHGTKVVSDKDKYRLVLKGLLHVLMEKDNDWKSFLNNTGQYHFVIEILAGDKVIGRSQLLHVNVESKKELFIFDSLYKDETTAETRGTLVKNYVVVPATNNVRLVYKLFHSEKTSVDWSTFNSLSNLVLKFNALSAIAPGATAAMKPVQDILSKIFDTYTEKKFNVGGEMSFADFGVSTRPSQDVWTLNSEGVKPQGWTSAPKMEIKVNFKTLPSRLWTVNDDGKFKTPVLASQVLYAARIEDQNVLQILSESKNKEARSLAEALLGGEKMDAEKLGNACSSALAQLLEGLKYTHRDAVLVYWSLLNDYKNRHPFRNNKGAPECAQDEAFAAYGLPVVAFPPPVVAVASGKDKEEQPRTAARSAEEGPLPPEEPPLN